ncbi:MAG: hypothetical protein AAF989_15980, partial [Planctomycetota bacterium]
RIQDSLIKTKWMHELGNDQDSKTKSASATDSNKPTGKESYAPQSFRRSGPTKSFEDYKNTRQRKAADLYLKH